LATLLHGGPLAVGVLWRNARHLPHGRSQAGDRHLNFYETRDNLGEIDEDPLPKDDEVIDSGYTDAEPDVIDVEVEALDPAPITPGEDGSPVSVDLSGPMSGPPGSGLMTIEDAVEAAAVMRSRANICQALYRT
jgi:hypothetical protein